MPVRTTDEAIKKVKKWMEDRGIFIADKTDDGSYFLFEGSFGNGLNFAIQQPKNMKRVIGVLLIMKFAPQHIAALKSMSSQERCEFFWNLRKDLLFAPPSVSFNPDENNPNRYLL
jgi:hypothetical protein